MIDKNKIVPIETPKELVSVIDDLKHYLKYRDFHKHEMLEDFNDVLNRFIIKWKLDGSQHDYATIPGTENAEKGGG